MAEYVLTDGITQFATDLDTQAEASAHAADTTSVHGIADTAALATTTNISDHSADTTAVHGIADTSALATVTNIADHSADTTAVHGITDTSKLLVANADVNNITIDGGKDTLALSNTTANVGITIGADTNLYREGADILATDDKLHVVGEVEIDAALNHDGSTVGFYGTAPIAKQTGVAVDAAGIHGALVALGLIAA